MSTDTGTQLSIVSRAQVSEADRKGKDHGHAWSGGGFRQTVGCSNCTLAMDGQEQEQQSHTQLSADSQTSSSTLQRPTIHPHAELLALKCPSRFRPSRDPTVSLSFLGDLSHCGNRSHPSNREASLCFRQLSPDCEPKVSTKMRTTIRTKKEIQYGQWRRMGEGKLRAPSLSLKIKVEP